MFCAMAAMALAGHGLAVTGFGWPWAAIAAHGRQGPEWPWRRPDRGPGVDPTQALDPDLVIGLPSTALQIRNRWKNDSGLAQI